MMIYKGLFLTCAGVLALAGPLAAQQGNTRRATISGNGNPNEGKCTIEVVVDGGAEVRIEGAQGTLRDLSGRPPEWRRFQCTSPMPDRPADFRFEGVDGRGRVQLVGDPRNGGPAVVRIQDSSSGPEGYTFDLMWGGRRNDVSNGIGEGRPGNRFTTEQAVRVCQTEVRRRVSDRFHTNDVRFESTNLDNNPGRRDWVVGTLEVERPGPDRFFQFSCSVNFDNGRVRSVDLSPADRNRFRNQNSDRSPRGAAEAMSTCRNAVEERVRRDGYRRVDFGAMRVDDQPGRNDWIVGSARGERGRGSEEFRFGCQVDLRTGNVRTVNVNAR